MVQGTHCFLDDDNWKAVLHHESQAPGLDTPQSVRLSDEFYEILATLPGLINLTNSLHKVPFPNEADKWYVVQRAKELWSSLERWYGKITAGTTPLFVECPSSSEDKLFPSVYRFENHHMTGLFSSYYACLIVINDILTSFPPTDDFSSDNRNYAIEICKSVEYAHSSGFVGAYSIIFPLMAAYLASGPEVRHWIKKWPGRFGKYFDVKVWGVFEEMDKRGGLVMKRQHRGIESSGSESAPVASIGLYSWPISTH